jgi:hypothetical protein
MRQDVDEPPPALAIHAGVGERQVTQNAAHGYMTTLKGRDSPKGLRYQTTYTTGDSRFHSRRTA